MKEVVQELKKREDLKHPLEQTVLPSIDDFKKDESPKRQKTDLSRNDLLLQKIKNNDPEIVKLDLICEKDSNFVSNLIKALKENTLVKEIVLYKTSLDNESIKNLNSIINSNKITHLDLTNILLDKEEIEILSNALVNNNSLNHLALILIPMEMESLRKLIENIKSTNVSTLTLWGNNFGDSGAEIITELFYSDSPIKYLNIGSNNISKAGAEIIARNIIAAKLIELNIENNDIKEGVINLLTALETISTLKINAKQYRNFRKA